MNNSLLKVIERARRSPFYQSHLPKGRQWSDMPITTKAHLREQYPFGLLAVPKNGISTYHESSGTEGKPISSYFSETDWNDIATRFLRNAVGLMRKDSFFIKTPYSMVTTAHQAHAAAKLVKALIIPADNRSLNMTYPRVIQLLRDLEVTVTWSLPTEVLLWGLAAKQMGLNPATDFPQLRAFWVAGESLSEGKKQMLKRLWGNKAIFEDYGSTETGSLAGECRAGQLHVWSDRVLFEILNSKDSTISREGRGKLLVTPLYREAMPLIRYLIEDEVELSPSRCTCASTRPVIKILGRDSDTIRIQNRRFFPSDLEDVIFKATPELPVYLWKAEFDDNTLTILIHCPKEVFDSAKEAISAAVSRRLGITVPIKLCEQSEFISPDLFKEKHSFSKPKFVLRKDTYENNYPTLR